MVDRDYGGFCGSPSGRIYSAQDRYLLMTGTDDLLCYRNNVYITKYNCVFSIGGHFSDGLADLGAARLGRRGIDRGLVGREPHRRLRPVACTARSQSRENRVSSRDAPPSLQCRAGDVNPALRQSSSKKKRSVDLIYFPYEQLFAVLYEIRTLCPSISAFPHARK